MLIDAGADATIFGGKYGGALEAATANGKQAVAEILQRQISLYKQESTPLEAIGVPFRSDTVPVSSSGDSNRAF